MPEDIVNIQGAAKILSERHGRTIQQDYIRQLRKHGKLRAINEPEEGEKQTKSYLFRRGDIEKIKIGPARVRGVRKRPKRISQQSQN